MPDVPRLGLNYVPSENWWYSWVDWNAESIRRDLGAIADLGADHIRIHCLWPVLQPNASMVSDVVLVRLEELLDIANDAGLDVIVTVFNGWLSGFDFRPHWLAADANIFANEEAVGAQLAALTAVAGRVGHHPRFLGFDIANEPSVLADGVRNVVTREEGDAWLERLLAHCEAVAPGKMHSVGMDHLPWMRGDAAFSRAQLAHTGAITPVHSWIYFTGALERYGPDATGTLHLAEYLLELAKAYADDSERPVWLQEYGASTDWLSSPGEFLTASTRAALSVSGLWGLTWWCSHDISRDLAGFAELEYELGLLTVDNVVKPAGEAFKAIAQALRDGAWSPPEPRTAALILDDGTTPDLDFADAFFALIDQGLRPAIVLRSRAASATWLARTGLQTLIEPTEALTPPRSGSTES